MGRIRVLLADDNREFADGVRTWLESQGGFEVVGVVHTGRDAIREAKHLNPDLVLTDLNMPDLNGIEVSQLLKSSPDAPRVVVVSLHESETIRAKAWSAGADGYVPKPRVMDDLMVVIRELFPESARKGPGDEGKARVSRNRGMSRDLSS